MATSESVYNDASITISDIIGRKYNNPFGEKVLAYLSEYIPLQAHSQVLDIGAGRGHIDFLIHKKFHCPIVGVELSPDMYRVASNSAIQAGIAEKIRFLNADFFQLDFDANTFDLIIGFDVFAYFPDAGQLFRSIKRLLKPAGMIAFSDYFCQDSNDPDVIELVNHWQIEMPRPFAFYEQKLVENGFEIMLYQKSSDVYYDHWSEMAERLREKQIEIFKVVSTEAYQQYYEAVLSILRTAAGHNFGHLFAIAQKR
jgi:cyclopropane fatty-acyl-phospholipid synthase-like methyltransferase